MGLTAAGTGLEGWEVMGSDGMVHRDLSDVAHIVGRRAAPFYMAISGQGKGAKPRSKKVEWTDDRYHKFRFNLGDDIDDSSTSLELAAYGTDVWEGAILEVGTEQMWVTAVNTSTNICTVVRGFAGTTAAAHSNGDLANLVGQASYDNVEFPEDRSLLRTASANYIQHVTLPVEVDDITIELDTVGAEASNEYDNQILKVSREAMVIMDRASIWGKKQTTNPEGSATTPGTMDGIRNLISTNTTDASGARLSKAHLNSLLEAIVEEYGGMPNLIMGGTYQVGVIDSWNEGRRRIDEMSTRFSPGIVTQYVSRFGVQNVMLDWNAPSTELYVVDTTKISVRELIALRVSNFARESTSRRGLIQIASTLELRGEAQMGYVSNLSDGS